jgi:hypothetical protein
MVWHNAYSLALVLQAKGAPDSGSRKMNAMITTFLLPVE